MKLFFRITCPFIFIFSFFCFYWGRTMPSGKLWQEYNVLYVPSSTDDFLVTQIFSEVGIKDYVSLYNQYLPVSLTAYSPEISMFNLNKENPSYSYYKDREAYFFDKSYAYRLYYIPKNQAYKISECQALFAQKNISSNSDQTSSYPFLLPIIYALAVIILLLFSRHRLIFTLSALPSLLFLIYNPFFPLAISSLLLLFCSF